MVPKEIWICSVKEEVVSETTEMEVEDNNNVQIKVNKTDASKVSMANNKMAKADVL